MSSCILEFRQNSPLWTRLVDKATGDTKYQIDTRKRFFGSVTQIRKLDSFAQPSPSLGDINSNANGDVANELEKGEPGDQNNGKGEGGAGEGLAKANDEIARIYWKQFSSDKIVFQGKKIGRRGFLPKCGKMNGSYAFTGPDGVRYRWAMGAFGMNYPKLVTTGKEKTVIAEFHRARYFVNKREAQLEVQPAGMDMLDYIILTFVFAENKRRERESRIHDGGEGRVLKLEA